MSSCYNIFIYILRNPFFCNDFHVRKKFVVYAILTILILLPDIIFSKSITYQANTLEKNSLQTLSENTIKFVFAGDIMMARNVAVLLQSKNNDYTFPFQKIKESLQGIDIKVANLEGGITNNVIPSKKSKRCGSRPTPCCGLTCHFKHPPDVLKGIVEYAGFNIINIENNHMDDYTNERNDTIKILNEQKISFFDHNNPFTIENIKNCKIIIYGHNIVNGPPFSVTLANMVNQLKKASPNVFQIIYFHGGMQYSHDVSATQQKMAESAIDSGAGMIIFTHAHVTKPSIKYKEKYIHYGLGNFVFDHNNPLDDTLNFNLLKFDLENCKNVINYQVLNGRINEDFQPELI